MGVSETRNTIRRLKADIKWHKTSSPVTARNFLSVAFEESVLSEEIVCFGEGESESRIISDI
jgi:hypothetical protein